MPLKQDHPSRHATHNGIKRDTHCMMIVYIFTNLSARVGYDTTSIFKRSLTGLNSVSLLLDELPHQG